MGSAPQPTEPIDLEERCVCVECGQANVIGETFCNACGVALEEDGEGASVTPLEPLPIGTVLADTYRLTALFSTGQENRYRAIRQTDDGQSYLIAERSSDQADVHSGGAFQLFEQLSTIQHPALMLPPRPV